MPIGTQISLETAITWITAWREKTDIDGNAFKASNIPMNDVRRIMDELNSTSVRAYNGYNEELGIYKLILVGVNANGEDIIITNASSPESKIYDMTLPCPDTCDTQSPLYTCEMPSE